MIYIDIDKNKCKIEGNPRVVGEECEKILRELYRRYDSSFDDSMYAKGKILDLVLKIFKETDDRVEWKDVFGYAD